MQMGASLHSLSTTHYPVASFQACGPALKRLVVHGTTGQHVEELNLLNHTLSPAITLESFESHSNPSDVAPRILQSLTRRVWNSEDHHLEDLRSVLKSCAESLKYLDLCIGPLSLNQDNSRGQPTGLILAQSQLTHFSIQAYLHALCADPLSWLQHELARRETPYQRLRSISIILYMSEPNEWDHLIRRPRREDNERLPLGETLADHTLYPSVQSVQIHLSCQEWIIGATVSTMKAVA
ncbi:hypothetical protein BKA70DRAFT_454279 [Coprinopsis sp. MPI-PUGE-AT-0042]|nr:hypothetical protein BKA70DRAFT_454279 [Coprinopsis sp. MPI-PUGE-AT-0042]